MDNTLKFRVYDIKNKCYIDGSIADLKISEDGELAIQFFGQHDSYEFNQEDMVVEKCSGFKDKNLNLIYANDFIKSSNNSNILIVKQEDNGLWQPYIYKTDGSLGDRVLPLADLIRLYDVEVVGNLYSRILKNE